MADRSPGLPLRGVIVDGAGGQRARKLLLEHPDCSLDPQQLIPDLCPMPLDLDQLRLTRRVFRA